MNARINYLIVYLIVAACLLLSEVGHAQDYWGPDTTTIGPEVQTFGEMINYAYGSLDQHLTTTILTDRMPAISEKEKFTGLDYTVESTLDDFYAVYTELTEAMVPYTRRPNFFEVDSVAQGLIAEHNIYPISLLRYKYNTITEEAKEHAGIYWDGHQAKLKSTALAFDVFSENEAFMLAPLAYDIILDDGIATFSLSSDFVFTNVEDIPVAVAIDFDDGNGFREVLFDEPIEVYYATDGEKNWKYVFSYASEDYREGSINISTRGADLKVIYDCGEGAIIYKDLPMVDYPQQKIRIAATAQIVNTKNSNPNLVTGELGVYYGCGNEECVIKKPLIVVSGFGPEVSPIVRKKGFNSFTADGMLFHHVNGMYGEDAPPNMDHGANNGTNILYKLRNEGYDIVMVYFDNGVDFVQNHAALVMKAIDYVNEQKKLNGSKYENVIMGQSMGGLSSRYALAKWEKLFMRDESETYKHHQCRLWISWEGEMQGATIPLGLQYETWYMFSRLPVAISLMVLDPIKGAIAGTLVSWYMHAKGLSGLLNNAGAKSMLTYHYSNNMSSTDTEIKKHPYHVQLFEELNSLGYPSCRRVAIANGSSTVQRPEDVSIVNQICLDETLMKLRKVGNNNGMPYYFHTEMSTGQALSSKYVFKSKFILGSVAIPSLTKSTPKFYTYAEAGAPGAYERFYQGIFYKIAKNYPGSPALHNYRVPFVPTTSIFDVQDDYSIDFGYKVSKMLFFRKQNIHDDDDLFGYPHNNPALINPIEITPFHSCFASDKNEMHLQNPSNEISNYILLEVQPENLELQNRIISGNHMEVYSAQYEARGEIKIGKNVTEITPEGDFKILKDTDVEIVAERITIKSGFHARKGSKVKILGTTDDPLPNHCFHFNSTAYKQGNSEEDESLISENRVIEGFFTIYPNPTMGDIKVKVSDDWIDGTYKVVDLTGRILLEKKIVISTFDCQLDPMPNVAFLMIEKNGRTQTQKLIKL